MAQRAFHSSSHSAHIDWVSTPFRSPGWVLESSRPYARRGNHIRNCVMYINVRQTPWDYLSGDSNLLKDLPEAGLTFVRHLEWQVALAQVKRDRKIHRASKSAKRNLLNERKWGKCCAFGSRYWKEKVGSWASRPWSQDEVCRHTGCQELLSLTPLLRLKLARNPDQIAISRCS